MKKRKIDPKYITALHVRVENGELKTSFVMENEAKDRIRVLEIKNSELSEKLRIAQDMNLELWKLYQKSSKRLHVLESLLEAMNDKLRKIHE